MTHDRGRKTSRRTFLQVALLSGAAGELGRAMLSAQGRTIPPTSSPMKIGIIGSGRQGGSLGLSWAKAGHEVLFSSRNPDNLAGLVKDSGPRARAGLPQEAAAFGDVVLIAVPYSATPQIGKDFGALMKGKVVIECGNPVETRDGQMAVEAIAKGSGLATAAYLPGTRVVRAFNALSYVQVRDEAYRSGERLGIPVAGDDPAAVKITVQLVQDAGFEAVVVGGLARAKEFDRGTSVYVKGMTARQIRQELKLP